MSYILDALKKSDQKRKLGQVPDLQADHSVLVYDERRRRLGPLLASLLGIVLLVNILLWVWWGGSWQRQVAQESTPMPAVQLVAVEKPVPMPPLPAVSESLAEVPTEEEQGVASRTTVDPALEQFLPEVPLTASSGPRPADTALADREASEAAVAEPRDDVELTVDFVGNDGAVSVVEPVEVMQPPPAEIEVLGRTELPDHIRAALPEMSISLHFYSNEPSARLVRMNGQHLREGDLVDDGLRLLEITRNGVVLSYSGYRFRVDRF
jgi:general secretion pathway protein B